MSLKDNTESLPESTYPIFPFPEWSDSEVNQEHWETTTKEKKGDVTKQSTLPETEIPPEKTYFADEQVVLLPSSVNVSKWKRLEDIYPNADFVITQGIIDFAGLKDGSKNVMHSEFMRSFISMVGILEYMSVANPWPVESVTSNYFPNTEKESWKPWHHIYSLCKAGKGTHSPKFNRSGKYIVRLHWMGCWRKIYVDDHLPVDNENNVLLPHFAQRPEPEVESDMVAKPSKSKQDGKDKRDKKSKKDKSDKQDEKHPPKMIVEIWQFILCKALLKIASLSWNENSELVDFCPISCLTGWVFQKLDTLGMSSLDIWKICESFAPKYEWDIGRDKSTASKKETSEMHSKGSKKSSKSSKGTAKSKSKSKLSVNNILSYAIVATCFDIKKLTDEETLQDIPATWSCDILIEQVRDIPLDKPPPKAEFARWKRFRWIAWAIRKGIISPDDNFNVQCLKLFSSLNKCPEVDRDATINAKNTKSDKSKKSSKSSKKSSKSSTSKKSQVKVFSQLDRSVWIDFSKVQYAITVMYVFFKPSQFHTKIKLSDTMQKNEDQKKPTKKDKKSEVQEIYYPSTLRESHNEPLYIFSDSLDHKFVVLNLSQMGNVQRLLLEKSETEINEQNFCYLAVETYDWQTNKCGDINLFINTRATKTALVYFKPGRFLSKLWVKSDNCFVVTVLAETPMVVGNHQTLVNAMTSESLSLTQLSHDVSTNFGKLVQSFGTPSYLDSMRNFYGTYKSSFSVVPKTVAYEIYRAFLNEVIKVLGNNVEVKFALKVLFLDPFLTKSRDVFKTQESDVSIIFCQGEDEMDPKQIDRAAVKIQSVLKCISVKKLLTLHDAKNVKYVMVYENLKKIYGQIFSLQNRKSCIALIRNVFYQLTDADYIQKYPITTDLRSVITNQSFEESVNSNENAWVLLIRKKFFCTSTKPIKIGIYCYCSLKKYVVRAFDNDSGEEFFRLTNNVVACSYKKNSGGYTVLSYGWAEETTTITSTLYITCQKEATPQIYLPEQATYETSLTGCYKPNVKNQICKCVLNVNQNTTVTLRLLTSYNAAKIRLYCMNEYGQILNEIVGMGDIVLPVTHLEVTTEKRNSLQKPPTLETQKVENTPGVRNASSQKLRSKISLKSSTRLPSINSLTSSSKNFYVEAFVLDDSWPLTRKEWMVVVDERKKSLLYPNESGDFYMKMRGSSTEKRNSRENPYWQLHVVYDANEALILSNDERREAEIRSIKQEWYKSDPNRAAKSREIRDQYLQMHRANYIGLGSDSILLPKLDQATSYLFTPTGGKSSLVMVTRSKISPRSANSLRMRSPRSSKSRANSPRDLKSVDSPFRTNSLSNSFEDKLASDERLLKWNPVIEILAPFDMDKFMKNIENVSNDDRVIVTEEWERLEENNRTEATEKYLQKLHYYQDNMDKVLCDQIENFIILKQWQDENKEKSTNKIKSAYKLKDKFIEYLMKIKETLDAESKDKKKDNKIGSKKSSKKGSKK